MLMVLFQLAFNPAQVFGSDFFNFLLPWGLTFVLSYVLLMNLKIFSDPLKQKISLALAFVFAFFVTASAGPQLAGFFMEFFGNAAVYITGVLILAMFVTMVTGKGLEQLPGTLLFWVTVIVAVVMFLSSGGRIPGFQLDQQTATLIFWGVILGGAVIYVTQRKAEEKKPAAPSGGGGGGAAHPPADGGHGAH